MNNTLKICSGIIAVFLAFMLNIGAFGQELLEVEQNSDSTHIILNYLEKDMPFGKIKINQDRRVELLLRKHISYNDSVGIQGWRILIYHGRNIKQAQDAGALFSSSFPDLDLPSLVDYQAPDFKTLVGAFRTREEAYRLHQQIISEFEFSYLVHATIKPAELK